MRLLRDSLVLILPHLATTVSSLLTTVDLVHASANSQHDVLHLFPQTTCKLPSRATDEKLSEYDHRGKLCDLVLQGYTLERNGNVYELAPQLADNYGRKLPPMKTFFVVVDRPDDVHLCGLKETYSDWEDYCTCTQGNSDARRCRHLWAMEFHVHKRGIYTSTSKYIHPICLDGSFPEIRAMCRAYPRTVDPLVDMEGLCIFQLLGASSVFLELWDRFTSRTEMYAALSEVLDKVHKGEQVNYGPLTTAMKSMSSGDLTDADNLELGLILGGHDAAALLHATFAYFDERCRDALFRGLLRQSSRIDLKCIECGAETVLVDTEESWKKVVVPSRIPQPEPTRDLDPDFPLPPASDTIPTIFELVQQGETHSRRRWCKKCFLYAYHRVTSTPTLSSDLLLIDVHQNPREPLMPYTVPMTHTHLGKRYELVGFLLNDTDPRSNGNYTAATRRLGMIFEHVGHNKLPFRFGANESRYPAVILYQRQKSRACGE